MKFIQPNPAPRAQFVLGIGGVVALSLLLVTSCATQRQVESIVARSNAAMLAGSLGDIYGDPAAGEGADGASGTNAGWRTAVAQIEEFASTHTNDPAIVNPLRVREAMVLLENGQTRQGREMFSRVDGRYLPAHRDQSLWLLRTNLVWYYGAPKGKFDESDLKSATAAVADLTTQINRLSAPADQGARDYLAVTRAWITLRLADSALDRNQQRQCFADAFNCYGSLLSSNELHAIAAPPTPSARTQLDLSDYRIAWSEALIAVGTNTNKFRQILYEGVTNDFRVRLQAGR